MSRQSLPLSDFLASLAREPEFPKSRLQEFLSRSTPSKAQCLGALRSGLQHYQRDCLQYKQAAVAIWVCGVSNIREAIEQGLNFFESLICSRLLLLVFDGEGEFVLEKVLLFLEEPLEVMTRKALQLEMRDKLMRLFTTTNRANSKFNEVLFLLQLLLVKKIQKHLDEPSQQQFLSFLRSTLPANKMDRVQQKQSTLRFRYSALLRENQESSETYQLYFKDDRLCKQLEKTTLPHWTLQAFSRSPKPLDMAPFYSYNLLEVFLFMSQAEIYASSPKVDDLEQLIPDERFLEMFECFLLGQQIGQGTYRFGCQTALQTISVLREQLAKENQSYRSAIVSEVLGWNQGKGLDN